MFPYGEIQALNVLGKETILYLKKVIFDLKEIPVEKQQLKFGGQILENGKTFQFYGIGKESKIELSIV